MLPSVESGKIILIGTTTENPYFAINKALISRSIVVKLEQLKNEDLIKVLKNAKKEKRGLGDLKYNITDKQYDFIANISTNDVRRALNGLEIAVLSSPIDDKRNNKC